MSKRIGRPKGGGINWKNKVMPYVLQLLNSSPTALTLRQIFYKIVSMGLIKKTHNQYDYLGDQIRDYRRDGKIDWDKIEDRTRTTIEYLRYENPTQFIDTQFLVLSHASPNYRGKMWKNQPHYIEVWLESETLVRTVELVTQRYGVPLMVMRGYISDTMISEAIQNRFIDNVRKKCFVLHIGDLDPSGLDMTRDLKNRFDLIGKSIVSLTHFVDIDRIGLSHSQLQHYNKVSYSSPFKTADPRSKKYPYKPNCWELDCLDHTELMEIVEEGIKKHIIDKKIWKKDKIRYQTEKAKLNQIWKKRKKDFDNLNQTLLGDLNP